MYCNSQRALNPKRLKPKNPKESQRDLDLPLLSSMASHNHFNGSSVDAKLQDCLRLCRTDSRTIGHNRAQQAALADEAGRHRYGGKNHDN